MFCINYTNQEKNKLKMCINYRGSLDCRWESGTLLALLLGSASAYAAAERRRRSLNEAGAVSLAGLDKTENYPLLMPHFLICLCRRFHPSDRTEQHARVTLTPGGAAASGKWTFRSLWLHFPGRHAIFSDSVLNSEGFDWTTGWNIQSYGTSSRDFIVTLWSLFMMQLFLLEQEIFGFIRARIYFQPKHFIQERWCIDGLCSNCKVTPKTIFTSGCPVSMLGQWTDSIRGPSAWQRHVLWIGLKFGRC